MDLASLKKHFASSPFLTFDEENGLVRVHVKTPQATATIYLQGAHLTAWQPAGHNPVIFLSRKSFLAPGKPIRGGIPLVFPWFAGDKKQDRIDGHPGPMHGFARTELWTLANATHTGDNVTLTFTLGPTDVSRALGFEHFRVSLAFTIGPKLNLAMTVTNDDTKPLTYEEAFHTYFCVTDIHEVTIDGLEPTPFIDKTDAMKLKPAATFPIKFTAMVDRVYLDTGAPMSIHDGTIGRRVNITKTGSNSTIVFNPWRELSDLGPWEWHEMVAVESANVDRNSITLAPGATHTLGTTYSVTKS